MPSFNEHKQKVEENLSFLSEIQNLDSRYVTWEVVSGFYLFLHLFEQLFDIHVYQNGKSNILKTYEKHSMDYAKHLSSPRNRWSPHVARRKIVRKLVKFNIISSSVEALYDDLWDMSVKARYEPIQLFFDNYLLQGNLCPNCNSNNIVVIHPVSIKLKCNQCDQEYSCNFQEIDEINKEIVQTIRVITKTI